LTTLYYSAGLCQRCHRFAPQVIDSCVDCYCWGVTRTTSWLCEGCRGWRRRFPVPAICPSCGRTIAVNAEGFCRLCWRQSVGERPHGTGLGVVAVNRHGQQLFFADLFRRKRLRTGHEPSGVAHHRHYRSYPVAYQQLTLLDLPRDLNYARQHGFSDPPDPVFAALLDQAVWDHVHAHGWSKTRLNAARQGIRILLSLQDTPGAAIKASEVASLGQILFAQQPILDILSSAGLLDDDREPPIVGWFARQIDGLPDLMRVELRIWFDILRLGSTTPPRSRPRSDTTVRLRVRYAMPALRAWAADGHVSLREITRDHIQQALPDQGSDRSLVGQALRSLFRTLKARRMVFTNPTTHIHIGQPEARLPLPVPLTVLREALHADKPVRAVIAALIGFHALRNGQLRTLMLSDAHDGRLHLPDRTILLAPPARERLAAWLDHRAQRWPATANPHLLINAKTAVRTGQVSHLWINKTLGLPAQAVREDRILDEAIATGGDLRRLGDLFGLSVKAAERYTSAVKHDANRLAGSQITGMDETPDAGGFDGRQG
jgi:hypothetical protein